MRAVGEALQSAGVAAVYLVHGTFLGSDALGVLMEISRFAPGLADVFRRWNKQVLDAVAGDKGNFTLRYADELQRGMQLAGCEPIPVRLFHWSSENHHLGRADGAVRLIHELLARKFAAGSRVLLWGHSHGGNVFALATNLLATDRQARCEFFDRARPFYRAPWRRRDDVKMWSEVREAVCEQDESLPGVALDFVTLGTPVRYGWETNGYSRLLHFIHHRCVEGQDRFRAVFPPTAADLISAAHGDFIQQIGIAGTNIAPAVWSWRSWLADRRLSRLLQTGCDSSGLLAHWRCGQRVHNEGLNLLVEYGQPCNQPSLHLFGHAPYTRLEWQLFHAEQVAQCFYELKLDEASAETSADPSLPNDRGV